MLFRSTQGTVTEQPITGTRTINGLNTLDFSTESLDLGTELELNGGMMFAVIEADNVASYYQIMSHQYPVNVQARISAGNIQYATTQPYWLGGPASTGTISASTPAIAGFIGDTSMGFSIDGTFEDSGTGNDGSGLTAYKRIGAREGYEERFDGKMGEIIFVEGDVSTATRQKIEGYLAHKWGTTLPSGHPYINYPPLRG